MIKNLKTGQEEIKACQAELGDTVTMVYESLQHATEDKKTLLQGQEEIKKTVISHKKYIKSHEAQLLNLTSRVRDMEGSFEPEEV